MTSQKLHTVVQNIEYNYFEAAVYSVFLGITENVSVQFKLSAAYCSFFKMSINFLCPLKCSVHGTRIPSPSRVICSQVPVTRTPDNSNLFGFPFKKLEGSSYQELTVFQLIFLTCMSSLPRQLGSKCDS